MLKNKKTKGKKNISKIDVGSKNMKKMKVKVKILKKVPSFETPQEMSAFYKAEGDRVKEAMNQFKLSQAEASLNLAKSFFMKIMSQKNSLNEIAADLKNHRKELDKKISTFKSEKTKHEINKSSIQSFVLKIKKLEDESKKILDVREELIKKEITLIKEMNEMSKEAQKDLNLTDLETADSLAEFESTKEAAIFKARDLLSEEMAFNFADNSILDHLDDKAHTEISNLNNKLAKLQGVKKEILKKLHLTEITEVEANNKLSQANIKVKKLEEKYQRLLKK